MKTILIFRSPSTLHNRCHMTIHARTTMSMMLLFTHSHAIVFKSLRFGPFTLKRNRRVFKLKRGLHSIFESLRFQGPKMPE